ncbi:MAG: 8-amino-7-oxononanoate synthase [Acidaminococcaceae bacterium]|nr:8-amino-7-oxononanoate synthase [Acidaminococcaceae bacterium]MDD4722234.1 8-amino-7-oxononanoate synthase [Acidaminococcaceae bacterium]
MLKLEQILQNKLQLIEEHGLWRQLTPLRFITPVRAISKTGKEYLVFSSNNYLGLTHAPEVIAAVKEAAKFGTGSTGSPLTTGRHFEGNRLEKALAAFKHTESALIFNTGYMTNLGVIYGLVEKNDVIFSDELNHASIIDGCRISKAAVKVYKHSDMQDLQELLEKDTTKGQRYIITDGVFSMDGDIAKLPELVQLAQKYEACLYVDDAHAVGVLGADGSGTAAHYGLQGQVDLQVGTLSKALASEGGYVAGKRVYIDYLINKSRPFIFSTALSPASMAAAKAALELLIGEKDLYLHKLKSNTELMRSLLVQYDVNIIAGETPIIPIMLGDAKLTTKFAQRLEKKGILVAAIRPTTVPIGQSRLRLTITAAHSEEDIRLTAAAIGKIWQEIQEGYDI